MCAFWRNLPEPAQLKSELLRQVWRLKSRKTPPKNALKNALKSALNKESPMPMLRRLKKALLYAGAALALLLALALLYGAALQTELGRKALASEALVQTDTGWVQGWRLPGHSVFVGIPYAQAPVGDLRWAAPQPAAAWPGSKLALLPKAICAQPAVPELRVPHSTAEDCLGLNIFKPVNHTGKPLPVMLWLHGGGFVIGSGNFTLASQLAQRGQVMVVAINYRLGVLGFLAHPALGAEDGKAVGNYGLLDQQMAIAWVKRNAAAFGADPQNITIFGQSAGGSSVCAQLMSPAMAGQFQAAIVQSGVCSTQLMQSMPDALRLGEQLVGTLPCQGQAGQGRPLLRCLRALPVEKLLPLLGRVGATSEVPLRPVYGSAVLPEAPDAAFASGHFHRVPVMVGSTRDEGRLLVALEINQALQRQLPAALALQPEQLQTYFRRADTRALQAQYPPSAFAGDARLAFSAMLTDGLFACSAEQLRQDFVRYGQPVYAYEFAEAPPGSLIKNDQSGLDQGAFHGAEFSSLFYYPFFSLSAAQQQLAADMQDYWSSFARTHQPEPKRPGAAAWPAYTAAQPAVLQLQAKGSVPSLDFAQRHRCDFWLKPEAEAAATN
jgi:para-nitrobenzyl esterase